MSDVLTSSATVCSTGEKVIVVGHCKFHVLMHTYYDEAPNEKAICAFVHRPQNSRKREGVHTHG